MDKHWRGGGGGGNHTIRILTVALSVPCDAFASPSTGEYQLSSALFSAVADFLGFASSAFKPRGIVSAFSGSRALPFAYGSSGPAEAGLVTKSATTSREMILYSAHHLDA